jgi:aspartyl-tRNA(Asn)/glutamyl-tRNA(Gln) amidotransferase subunit C
MSSMKLDVKHIAKLANLPLTDKEIVLFEKQLQSTLTYIEQLDEIDTTGIKPTSQVTGLENVMRDDTTESSLSIQQATNNSIHIFHNFFQVKGLLDNE